MNSPARSNLTWRNNTIHRTTTVFFTHSGYSSKGRTVYKYQWQHTTDHIRDGYPPSSLPILTQGRPSQLTQVEKQKIHTSQTWLPILKYTEQHGKPWEAVPHESHHTEQNYSSTHNPVNNLPFKGRMSYVYDAACTPQWPNAIYIWLRARVWFLCCHGVYLSRKPKQIHCGSHKKAWHSSRAMMSFMVFMCRHDLWDQLREWQTRHSRPLFEAET